MSNELAVLNKYFESWISGRKTEASILRTTTIKELYFNGSESEVLKELVREEASDLEFRVETYSYPDWINYHKRDNNADKEFTRINSLLMFILNGVTDYKKLIKFQELENQIVHKSMRTILFEDFLLLFMAKQKEEMVNPLYKALLHVELVGDQFHNLHEVALAGGDLTSYEGSVDDMSDDVVFDMGLDEDNDTEQKNAYMTLALTYLYLGKKEDSKRVLDKLDALIKPDISFYWLFRFLKKELIRL